MHTFHIPVLGIGFSIDTPAKVAHLGISSCVSLGDDILIEKMRKFYCGKLDKKFIPISEKTDDFRAKRITAYLDMLYDVVKENHQKVKKFINEESDEIDRYMRMLPSNSPLRKIYFYTIVKKNLEEVSDDLLDDIPVGNIDVNIMTKLDREVYNGKELLPRKNNDAHAALRGFAKSKLSSSVVLSAGLNPSLYGYFEEFEDFFPNSKGEFKKKITLKVTDFRSALIQGKYLAKKGLWVSEFRIESGLNCGGHSFASDGTLMGPILEEFKAKRQSLINELYEIYEFALIKKNMKAPENPPEMVITAQGGVGDHAEHEFLLMHYKLNSVGWGSPFLLVPEAVNVDDPTIALISNAKEEDLYRSNISPLGIPFNSIRGNTKDIQKEERIKAGKPGSPCIKKYCSLSKEFTDKALCMASRQYQDIAIKKLNDKDLSKEDYDEEYEKIVEKACLCCGLGTTAQMVNGIDFGKEESGVSVCPGPNMAFFSGKYSLEHMVDHIYGRRNIVNRSDRPHMFIKECQLYIKHLKEEILKLNKDTSIKGRLQKMYNNLLKSIQYYKDLFSQQESAIYFPVTRLKSDLETAYSELKTLDSKLF